MLVISAEPAESCVFPFKADLIFQSCLSSLKFSLAQLSSQSTHEWGPLMWSVWGRICILLPPTPGKDYSPEKRTAAYLHWKIFSHCAALSRSPTNGSDSV